MLLGRSLVSITDVLSTHVRSKVQDEFNRMADDNGLIENMVQFLPQSQTSEELAEITKEMLRIGADVFGPLPEETFWRRFLLVIRKTSGRICAVRTQSPIWWHWRVSDGSWRE